MIWPVSEADHILHVLACSGKMFSGSFVFISVAEVLIEEELYIEETLPASCKQLQFTETAC